MEWRLCPYSMSVELQVPSGRLSSGGRPMSLRIAWYGDA